MIQLITKESLSNQATTLNVYLRFMLSFDLNIPNENQLITLTNAMAGRSLDKIGFTEFDFWVKRLTASTIYFINKYPFKKGVNLISLAIDLDEFQKIKKEEIDKYGIQIGWLRERIDTRNFLRINDFPYQTFFGLGSKKGHFTVNEVKLLRDAFVVLNKAKTSLDFLTKIEKKYRKDSNIEILKIRYMYFETILNSRMFILSFFAFFECFVNSIGHSYFKINEQNLSQKDIALLQGYKFKDGTRGGYMDLKTRIKEMEKVIKSNEDTRLNQLFGQNPFLSIFSKYQEIRNSSVHNSPLKTNINISAYEWLTNAEEFAKFTIEACLIIWKRLVNEKTGPNYLKDLNYEVLMEEAIEHNNAVNYFYKVGHE